MAQAAAPWIAKELLCGQSVAALDMATEDTATTAREPVTTASPSPPYRPTTPGQLPGRPAEGGKVLGRHACSPDLGLPPEPRPPGGAWFWSLLENFPDAQIAFPGKLRVFC